jgi:hypothetical protein
MTDIVKAKNPVQSINNIEFLLKLTPNTNIQY